MSVFSATPRVRVRDIVPLGGSPEDGDDQLWRVGYREGDLESTVTCRTFRADWRDADEVRAQFKELVATCPNDRPIREQITERLEALTEGGRPYLCLRFIDD